MFHVALEVGTINELDDVRDRLKAANAFMDQVDQPMHLSVYAWDPDGLPLEIVWRIANDDWTDEDLWRRPLDFDDAKVRWGADLATGSAAGEAA